AILAESIRADRLCRACHQILDDAVPLPPARPRFELLDCLLPNRRARRQQRYHHAQQEFTTLQDSWRSSSTGQPFSADPRLGEVEARVQTRHDAFLTARSDDVEKYLHRVTHGMAKRESQYSWQIEKERRQETEAFLAGLFGPSPPRYSIGLLVRCDDLFP